MSGAVRKLHRSRLKRAKAGTLPITIDGVTAPAWVWAWRAANRAQADGIPPEEFRAWLATVAPGKALGG